MAENPTTNHNLHRPPTGSQTGTDDVNWGVEVNSNTASIDELLTIRDTDANTSDYTPFVDALFHTTDTNQWYIGDGNQWVEIPWMSDSPNFVSAVIGGLTVNTGITADSSDESTAPSSIIEDSADSTWENGIDINGDYNNAIINTPNWRLQSQGLVSRDSTVVENAVGPKTSSYTVSETDETVFVDSSSGTFNVTLVSAYNYTGMRKTIIDHGGAAGTNAVTIATDDSATIDDASTYTLDSNYQSVTVVGDGTNWYTK